MGIMTGDFGHEDNYVNGAAARSGRYSPDRHVDKQIEDSDDRNRKRRGRGKTVKSTVRGVSQLLDALAR